MDQVALCDEVRSWIRQSPLLLELYGKGGGLCDNCEGYHNLSVHGHIGYCIRSSPWVKIWGKAWGYMQQVVMRWRATATFRDKFLLGKLMIPTKLFVLFVGEIGYTGAESSIFLF